MWRDEDPAGSGHGGSLVDLARTYYPQDEQWTGVRPWLEQVDLAGLVDHLEAPAAWEPDALQPWGAHRDGPPLLRGAVARAAEASPFVRVAARLLAPDLRAVVEALDAVGAAGLSIPTAARDAVLADLLEGATARLTRSLVAALHERSGAGLLSGASPEERFESFLAQAETDDFVRTWAGAVPTLLRACRTSARGRAAQLHDLADVVADERAEQRTHGAAYAGVLPVDADLVELGFGAGDTHAGGRSVCRLGFADGSVVFAKPRPLATEAAFYALNAVVCERAGLRSTTPRIRSGDRLSLMEGLVHRAPADDAETRAYYRQLGCLAAVLHVLGGHDMHFENVVAVGAVPTPVDLECLFRGEVRRPEEVPWTATRRVEAMVEESVAGSMVLPAAVQVGGETFQVGAAGMVAEQRSPLRTLVVRNAGRDDMTIVLDHQVRTETLTVPELGAVPTVSVHDAMDEVAAGVRAGLEVFRVHRDELAARIARDFADVRVRYLNAPSMAYGQLLRMLTHPVLAASDVQSLLAATRAAVFSESWVVGLLPAEVLDLLDGDVPQFTSTPSSTAVEGGPAGARVRCEVFVEAPLAAALRRLDGLDAAAVARQEALARMAFASRLDLDVEPTRWQPASAGGAGRAGRARDELLDVARRHGDDLLAEMVPPVAQDAPNWVDVRIAADGQGMWTPGPMDPFVYGGLTGVADVLRGVGEVTGEARYADAAAAVVAGIGAEVLGEPEAFDRFGVGGLSGVAGIADVLLRHGQVEAGAALLVAATRRVGTAVEDDALGGIAGLLAVLARWRDRPEAGPAVTSGALVAPVVNELVRRHEERRLAATAASGFAHGIAGLLPALRAVAPEHPAAGRLADELVVALDGFRIADDRGWHTSTEHGGRAYGWCHGSPGILLGAVAAHAAGGPLDVRTVDEAWQLVEEECFGRSFGLCHGDLGNLEIMRYASSVLGRPSVCDDDEMAADLVLSTDARLRGARPPRGGYTRSVLVGRTGVAHVALRLLVPDATAPLLW